jgi:hypothetical protein
MLGRMAAIDPGVAELARLRGGLVIRDDLLSLGMSDDEIRTRVKDGVWQWLQAGVYLVGAAPPTWQQRLHAGCLAGPGLLLASHRSAAFLRKFDGSSPGVLDLLTTDGHRFRPRGAILHRTDLLRPDDCDVIDGIPTTSVLRTLVDYASVVPVFLAERGVESVIRRGKTSEQALLAYVNQVGGRGRRGVGTVRRILDARPAGGPANGYLEVLAAHLDAADEEGLVRQHAVAFPDGEVVHLDWAFPDVKYDVEFDGDETHGTSRATKRDLQRDKTLRRLGWTVRRFPYKDVKQRPAWVTSEILATLYALRARLSTK